MTNKKKERAFDIGLVVSAIALVAIIVFILVFAFIPRPGIAPTDGEGLQNGAEATEPATDGVMRFSGVLPCDDCEGIRTELELRADGTFRLSETYLGRVVSRPLVQEGNWTTLRGHARDLNAVVYRINHDRLRNVRNYELQPDGSVLMVDERLEVFSGEGNYRLARK